MDKKFTNIDDAFKQAFDSWEADFSPSELKADWSQVSGNIPQAPVRQPMSKPFWGTGKILSLVSGAAIITTAGAILYNTYIYEGEKMASVAEPTEIVSNIPEEQIPVADDENTLSANTEEQLIEGETFSGNNIYAPKADQTRKRAKAKNAQANNSNNYVLVQPETPAGIYLYNSPADVYAKHENAIANKPAEQSQKKLSKKNFIFSDTILCEGKVLHVAYAATQMPEAGFIEWGDGAAEPLARNNNHLYKKTGQYRVRISDGENAYQRFVTVNALPKAEFVNYQCDELYCKFRNNSKQAFTYVWDFGDGSPAVKVNNPEHRFRDTGRFTVTLKSYSTEGCVDSFVRDIRVTSHKKPEVYDIFTPNGDRENDKFNVKITDESYYYIKIMDFNGRILFESNDKNQPWDGTVGNHGTPCADDTYIYLIKYKFRGNDQLFEEKGMVQLKR